MTAVPETSNDAAGVPLRRAIATMPRLNANEDEARIVEIGIAEGEDFERDQLLFTIETTKAANEVLAPCAGRVERIRVAKDEMHAVGAPLCDVWLPADAPADMLDFTWTDAPSAAAEAKSDQAVQISAKARMRAAQLGVAIEAVPPEGGQVRVADVERYAAEAGAAPARAGAEAPALRTRYAATDALIVGGSGHARTVIDAMRGSGFAVIGALDAAIVPGTPVAGDIRVLGDESLLDTLYERGLRTAFVGVGGATSNAARRRLFERLVARGFHLPPLVAETAYLGARSTLGPATYLFPGANVGPDVQIGANCIVNQNAVVAHDSIVADHVHLAPNAVVAGACRIGEGATLGMCATLLYGAAIGANCLVHNNVAVTQDLPDGTVLTLADVKRPRARSASD